MDEAKQKATTQKKKATWKNYCTVHGKCYSRNLSKATALKSSYGEWIGNPQRLKTWRKNSICVLQFYSSVYKYKQFNRLERSAYFPYRLREDVKYTDKRYFTVPQIIRWSEGVDGEGIHLTLPPHIFFRPSKVWSVFMVSGGDFRIKKET